MSTLVLPGLSSYRSCSECCYNSDLEKRRGGGLEERGQRWSVILPACLPAGSCTSHLMAWSRCGNPPALRRWALAQILGSVLPPTSLFQQAWSKLASFPSPKRQINLLPISKIRLPCFSMICWNSSCILAIHPSRVIGVVNTFSQTTA